MCSVSGPMHHFSHQTRMSDVLLFDFELYFFFTFYLVLSDFFPFYL